MLASCKNQNSYQLGYIDKRRCTLFINLCFFVYTFRHQAPESINIKHGTEIWIFLIVKSSHSNLSKISRMVLVHQYSVMMLSSGVSSTSRVSSMFPNPTMTCEYMASLLSVFVQSSRLTHNKKLVKLSTSGKIYLPSLI